MPGRGLGRGGLVVWISKVALSIWPASRAGGLERARCALDQLALVGRGFLSTQLATSALCPGGRCPGAAPVVGRAQLGVDVAQAVVAGVAAAELELDLAGHEVQLVVHHQDFLGLDLEEARQRGHRLARQVHEGLRLQQPHGLAVDAGARHQAR
jgi:hypothetical protein